MMGKSLNRHVFESFRLSGALNLVLIYLLLMAWSSISSAAVATYAKVITWTPPSDLLGDNEVEIAGVKGNYNWRLGVEAIEKKHGINVIKSIPANPEGPPPKGDWLVKDGLALRKEKLSTETAGHANALAEISFSAQKPINKSVDGVIAMRDEAWVQQGHGTSQAKADSQGSMQIVGAKVAGVTQRKNGILEILPDAKINTLTDQVGAFGGAKHKAAAAISDPVVVGFVDVVTGEVTESQLFSFFLSVDFAKLEWDDAGVKINLQEDVNAKASVAFNITSDWVIDPPALESKLTFTKGNFQVSGIFAALPWVVQDTEVTLSAGYLDSISLSYAVPLDATLLDDHVYTPYLTMSGEAAVSESVTVPEPSSLILAITGLAYLGSRQRRTGRLASVRCVTALRQG